MAEMRELVTVEQAERVIVLLAIALPVLGLAAGALVGTLRHRLWAGLALGLLCGLAGPAVWAMWRAYNGVIGEYGLDSVRGLLVNLALFVGVGLVVGLAVGMLWRRLAPGRREQQASTTRMGSGE